MARPDADLKAVLDQFVCVRLVQMWGADLSLFQFDGELTWAVFFLNADQTIYGRYGSCGSRERNRHMSVDGLRQSAVAALDLHREYSATPETIGPLLAGKRGAAPAWPTPEQIPYVRDTYRPLKTTPETAGRCVHCHYVPSGEVLSMRDRGDPVSDRHLWLYPLPEALGISLDRDQVATVIEVKPNSSGARAGIQPGDVIAGAGGQRVISTADIQWVLQNAPDEGKLSIQLGRSNEMISTELRLPRNWRRRRAFTWRESKWRYEKHLIGAYAQSLSKKERTALGLEKGLALKLKSLEPRAHAAGLRPGDVLVGLGGVEGLRNESEFIAQLLQHTRPGQTVRLIVLRGGNRESVNVVVR